MMSDNYTQYNDTELAALLCLDKPIDRAEMIRLARADDVEDFAQALEAAMDSQIYVPGAQAVTDMYRAAIARAEAAEEKIATLRRLLDTTTRLNTALLGDTIRLTGRVNELEDAETAWRPLSVEPPTRGRYLVGSSDSEDEPDFAFWEPYDEEPQEYDTPLVFPATWWDTEGGTPYGEKNTWFNHWRPLPAPPASE